MPIRLSTTLSKIDSLPNFTNVALLAELNQYEKQWSLRKLSEQLYENHDGIRSSWGYINIL
jgi:hypothetical protein